jgi:hypothetical protein
MILRIWRLVTLLLTALVMGTSFCHVLEMPVKMQADGQLWTTLQHTLYRYFAILGGTVEVGAILAAALLSYRVRGRSRAFRLSVVGAVGLAASFAVWLGFVNPVNRQTAAWTVDSIPGNWAAWRAQWEYGHAVRFALHVIAFSALTLSVLVETSGFHAPGEERDRNEPARRVSSSSARSTSGRLASSLVCRRLSSAVIRGQAADTRSPPPRITVKITTADGRRSLGFLALAVSMLMAQVSAPRHPADFGGGWAMIHAVVSTEINAPPERLAALYADYEGWPRLFPATIRGVRLLADDGQHKTIEVDHVTEGKVINIMNAVSPREIQLEEFKRRFDARFINRFEAFGQGTRYSVVADVRLKGAARLLGTLVTPIVRARLNTFVLEPMRAAVEAGAGKAATGDRTGSV